MMSIAQSKARYRPRLIRMRYSLIEISKVESDSIEQAGGDIELGVVIVAVSTIAEWIELSDIFSAGIGQTGLFSPYLKRALPLLEI